MIVGMPIRHDVGKIYVCCLTIRDISDVLDLNLLNYTWHTGYKGTVHNKKRFYNYFMLQFSACYPLKKITSFKFSNLCCLTLSTLFLGVP